MYDQKKVDRVNELVREIRDREEELEGLFCGASAKARAPQKCSKCGVEGHTARHCSALQNESPAI